MQYVSKRDVAFLYAEIFEKRAYLQHGIELQEGDCVVDVGANIGLFAAFAADAVGHHGTVVALEPIPPVYQAALANMQSLATEGASGRHLHCTQQSCMQGVAQRQCLRALWTGWGDVKVINLGVGDGSSESADFTFYPAAAGGMPLGESSA